MYNDQFSCSVSSSKVKNKSSSLFPYLLLLQSDQQLSFDDFPQSGECLHQTCPGSPDAASRSLFGTSS